MTQPLTKEQLAEMRQDYRGEDLEAIRVTALLDSHALIEQERDLAVAKLATAKVCECVHLADEECETPKCKPAEFEGVFMYSGDCPHCVNGVQFSDERARELLKRLARAEEIVASYNSMKAARVPFEVRDQLRAAREKKGAQ